MNTKHLLDKILDKWPAKVICLVIAIFLYFFHQASLIDSKTVVVPLQIIENGIVMHMGNTPKSVSVVVRAEDETIKSLSDKLFDVFTDVQMAWMNFEYDKLEELCGDELATSYIQELEVLKAKHGQNVIHDFDLKDLQIVRIGKVSGGIRIEVHMMVSFYDYVIDTTNNEVIRGSKKRKLTNHYRLMFVKGNERIVKCPKCGGEFVANSSTNCPYCRTFVNVTGYDYKLIQKGKI